MTASRAHEHGVTELTALLNAPVRPGIESRGQLMAGRFRRPEADEHDQLACGCLGLGSYASPGK